MAHRPTSQQVANAQRPANWKQEHDDFVKIEARDKNEDASTIVELTLANFSSELHENVAAWIMKRVGEVRKTGR